MSSEHATEQVPMAEIREGDMLQDPKSGNWIKVTQTAERTMSVTHRYSDGERTVIEQYRVYYGGGGEEIDSRFVTGLVNRERVIASAHGTTSSITLHTWREAPGSLIGMLVGVLGGPIGMLLGWGVGAASGALHEAERLDTGDEAIAAFGRLIPPGGKAILAVTDEVTTDPLEQFAAGFGGKVARKPLDEVLAELEAQDEVAREADKAARKAIREQKKRERKEDFQTRRQPPRLRAR